MLRQGNPMIKTVSLTLIFEVIVIWLGYIGMIQIAGVPMGAGAVWCGIATALCLVACGGLRRRWGYLVGWAAQAAIVALGVVYGDIGTSPLYTAQTFLSGQGGIAAKAREFRRIAQRRDQSAVLDRKRARIGP